MSDAVEYRDAPGFPGYRVGSDGSIWSCLKGNGQKLCHLSDEWKPLKPNKCGDYATVALCRGGKAHGMTVHALVLTTFIGPRPHGMVASHNNGNARDNRLSNLRWDTQRNNIGDKAQHGTKLVGTRLSWTKLTEESVREIRKLVGTVPLRQLAKRFGVTRHNIARIRDRKTWIWLS